MEIRRSAGAVMLALLASAPIAAAGEIRSPAGVVELFTSQGCNSCPPADQVLADIAKRGDVVALAYHVTYWDYLGWRDTLASAENTARQQDYGKAFGNRSVYTPQAVVNGREHFNGAKQEAIDEALGRMKGTPAGMSVDVKVTVTGDSFVIETGEAKKAAQEAHIVLVFYDKATPVTIERGENKGHTITYWNAVTSFQIAGIWHGEAQRLEMPMSVIAKKGKGGCAVLVQAMAENGVPGAILGATLVGRVNKQAAVAKQ